MDSDLPEKTREAQRRYGFGLMIIIALVAMMVRESGQRMPRETAIEKPPVFLSEINTASIQEIQLLPKVGKTIADSLIKFRVEQGPIRSPEQLKQIRGIGESRLAELRNSIHFGEMDESQNTR